MNYYLPRYDLPMVLGYTGPGLSFYSRGYERTSDLIPSFTKQEDLVAKSKSLENQNPSNNDDLLDTFFSR